MGKKGQRSKSSEVGTGTGQGSGVKIGKKNNLIEMERYETNGRIVTRFFSSRQVRWDLILRGSRKIHDMFLVPTQEVTTAFVSVFFFKFIYIIQRANSETSPAIFLKLAQILVHGYSGTLADLEENLLSSFRATIFQI